MSRGNVFYRDVLGLERIPRPDFGFYGGRFIAGSMLFTRRPVARLVARMRAAPDESHIAFCVDEGLETMLARLCNARVRTCGGWRTPPAAKRQFFVVTSGATSSSSAPNRNLLARSTGARVRLRIAVSAGSIGWCERSAVATRRGHQVDIVEPESFGGGSALIALHASIRTLEQGEQGHGGACLAWARRSI